MDEPRPDEGRRTLHAWIYGIIAGVAVLALMFIAYTVGTNQSDEGSGADTTAAATEEPKAPEEPSGGGAAGPGQELFVSNCGSCHTLSAAGTSGAVGPDLDTLAPDEAQVQAAIENGGAGSGGMPANIVTGKDAQEVAVYVSESAGGG